MADVQVRPLTGAAIDPYLGALADLRLRVFRDWPYLYDGDLSSERDYLQAYRAPGAVVVGAFDGDVLVGAATAARLEDHAGEFGAAFAEADLSNIYYLAESVLLPAYRGQGIGHRFFDLRETEARAQGRRRAVFCAVIRPDAHPLRPVVPRDHSAFWRGHGYAPLPGIVAHYAWRDVGTAAETEKPLQFWGKDL